MKPPSDSNAVMDAVEVELRHAVLDRDEEIKRLEAREVELAGVLKEWDTPGNHRDNKWWPRWEASRRAALTATPVEALERAEIMKKLPSLLKRAGNLVPMGTVEIERSEEDELVCTIDSVLTKLDALGKEEI
jgi:hypothetical protein